MNSVLIIALITSILLVIIPLLYPLILAAWVAIFNDRTKPYGKDNSAVSVLDRDLPSVTLIVAVHQAALVRLPAKLRNLRKLDYPTDKLEILIAGDGVTADRAELDIDAAAELNIKYFSSGERVGKNSVLNEAVKLASFDILVFSDVDAALERAALKYLVGALNNEVGGVAGRQIVREHGFDKKAKNGRAQRWYWNLEDFIKEKELAVLGSVTSNNGTICCIKRELFRKIPPSATDDLFIALSVVSQNRRFVYEPGAKAYITPPSIDLTHELARRRRIVTRSFGSMWHNKSIFAKFPRYGVSLFIHKILRRLIPLLLVFIILLSAGLASVDSNWALLVYLEVLLASLCFVVLLTASWLPRPARYLRYFVFGAVGTALGFIDFARGRDRAWWD